MSFLDKFKAGVAEAGNKAKTMVEINRLKLQNHNKQQEIDQEYQTMGKLLFEAAVSGAEPLPPAQFENHVNHILGLKAEIHANQWKISELGDANEAAPESAKDITPSAEALAEAPRSEIVIKKDQD
ncbi:hypothetical protein GCM10010912_27830 [Paenibacillus albidus]|uniref:Uncharacterized protein n=1 Tax=Paenibacillus albidus TaxID=2041023 RepID=A0A917CA23_9BACL|nr:hypothetical protein [Paenibacillus albidus]GGF81162.1 hypothetical protein GCM10010912_27830 [Paenibacillus albidus]